MLGRNNKKRFSFVKKDDSRPQVEVLTRERFKVQAEISQLERKCQCWYRRKLQLESEYRLAETSGGKRHLVRKMEELKGYVQLAEIKIANLTKLLIIFNKIIAFYSNNVYHEQWLAYPGIMSIWNGEFEQCLKNSTTDGMMFDRKIETLLELLNDEMQIREEASKRR